MAHRAVGAVTADQPIYLNDFFLTVGILQDRRDTAFVLLEAREFGLPLQCSRRADPDVLPAIAPCPTAVASAQMGKDCSHSRN